MRNRQELEREYFVLGCKITRLMEARQRQHLAIRQIEQLLLDLAHASSGHTIDDCRGNLELSLEPLLGQTVAIIGLASQTSTYREEFRAMQTRLHELGQALGLH